MTLLDNLSDPAKHVLDGLSMTALAAALFKLLPAITVVLTAIWVVMRMVESWQNIKINGRKLKDRP